MSRIVLNTFGSLGDLHPYLALALELKRRGHEPLIATSAIYREKVESAGLLFHPVRPDVGQLLNDKKALARMWHPQRGTEYLVRDYILPHLNASYEDLLAACQGADLVLTHAVAYAGPLVAEQLKLPWISVALQPLLFLSAYDAPVLTVAPFLPALRKFGVAPVKVILDLGRWQTRRWARPIGKLRRSIGLPDSVKNPILDGTFSPWGTLALFSSQFAQPQPDWPQKVIVCGFPFYDSLGPASTSSPALDRFLAAGEPPILFTLGSSAVLHPGSFYRASFEALRASGRRGILLIGALPTDTMEGPMPTNILVEGYLPYSEIMPRCVAIVHQGGIGTTAQALRAGRPMIVVPWSHDQPDNAHRLKRLGVSRTLPRSRYTARSLQHELDLLLADPNYAADAQRLSTVIAREDGVQTACNAIEQLGIR